MAIALTNEQSLRDASQAALEQHRRQYDLGYWLENLSVWLRRVAEVDRATFVSQRFQQGLWENEAVSATGQGHIDVSKVFADPSVAERLRELKQIPLPEENDARSD